MKKYRIAGAILLACALSLAGCNNAKAGADRPKAATIGEYVATVEVVHHIGGETAGWTAQGEEVERLRAWANELDCELAAFEEGQTPGDADGGEAYDFMPAGADEPGFSYIINGNGGCYLLVGADWYSVLNPSDPPVTEPQKEKLTLEKVKGLAQKGDALSWGDFEQYDSADIGFGLYILRYEIDKDFHFVIGGIPDETPMYMRLVSNAKEDAFIDIRTESIDDFIKSLNG